MGSFVRVDFAGGDATEIVGGFDNLCNLDFPAGDCVEIFGHGS
jgi:hypothetical protein